MDIYTTLQIDGHISHSTNNWTYIPLYRYVDIYPTLQINGHFRINGREALSLPDILHKRVHAYCLLSVCLDPEYIISCVRLKLISCKHGGRGGGSHII